MENLLILILLPYYIPKLSNTFLVNVKIYIICSAVKVLIN